MPVRFTLSLLADDGAGTVDDADAAGLQRDVDPGIVVIAVPPSAAAIKAAWKNNRSAAYATPDPITVSSSWTKLGGKSIMADGKVRLGRGVRYML